MLATALKRWYAAIVVAAGLVAAGDAAQPKRTMPPARAEMGPERVTTPRAKQAPSRQSMDRDEDRMGSDRMGDDRMPSDDRMRPSPDAMYSDGPGEDWSDNSVWDDSCDACGPCMGPACCGPRGMIFGGAEYLLVRTRLSEGVAEVRRTIVTNDDELESSTQVDQAIEYPFDHQSSFRTYLGYRLPDCCSEVRFTYWRLEGDSDEVVDGPADVTGGSRIIFGQLNNNPCDGEFFRASSHVAANIYDLDFSKCIPMGCNSGCGDCCPRWELKWIAGVRAADISRHDSNKTFNDGSVPETGCLADGDITADFTGAGPHLGLESRRYCGPCNRFNVYAKGTAALLIGDYNASRVLNTTGSETDPDVLTIQNENLSRVIPNFDLEVGGTWCFADHASLSAGYFFQAWCDLGSSAQITSSSFGPLDDSNILGFDGFFLRAEMCF